MRLRQFLAVSSLVLGQAATASEAAPPPPSCTRAEQRQFDFWIGEWKVYNGDRLAGQNSIRAIEGGCGLAESWRGARGSSGVSYNAWNAGDGRWHQFWISAQGYSLVLSGEFRDGAMRMSGVQPHPQTGAPQQQRITWTPNPDGSVRQLWEASDDGKTWQVVFDGRYLRER